MKRRAFIVLGPESTGTRLATRILIEAGGCHGSFAHGQSFDREIPSDVSPIAWRRSVPHMGRWLDLEQMLEHIGPSCETRVVVTIRDRWCTARSQVANKHVSTVEQGLVNYRLALEMIFDQLSRSGTSYEVLIYESLILHPLRVQVALLDHLGLLRDPPQTFVEIRNENTKRWLE